MNRLRLLQSVTLLMLATACQTIPSSGCGVLLSYEPAFQDKASYEYKAYIETNSELYNTKRLLDDYKVTRDSIRACDKHN